MIDDTLLEAEEKMDKAVEVAKENFAGIRTGRVNPGLFSKVLVDYYGAPTPLQQLASFQSPEARTLLISPYDQSSLQAIEGALRDSVLGANPSNDGTVIRVTMPTTQPPGLTTPNERVKVSPPTASNTASTPETCSSKG